LSRRPQRGAHILAQQAKYLAFPVDAGFHAHPATKSFRMLNDTLIRTLKPAEKPKNTPMAAFPIISHSP
jgi:hypothetical protein